MKNIDDFIKKEKQKIALNSVINNLNINDDIKFDDQTLMYFIECKNIGILQFKHKYNLFNKLELIKINKKNKI